MTDMHALHTIDAHRILRDEFARVLYSDPSAKVMTPGFGVGQMPLVEVVNDHFAGESGEGALREALRIIVLAEQGDPGAAVRARMWIAEVTAAHAEFHADDLAQRRAESMDAQDRRMVA